MPSLGNLLGARRFIDGRLLLVVFDSVTSLGQTLRFLSDVILLLIAQEPLLLGPVHNFLLMVLDVFKLLDFHFCQSQLSLLTFIIHNSSVVTFQRIDVLLILEN